MMLHAQQKCTEAITANLWPYALRHSNNAYNTTIFLSYPQGLSTLHIFTGTQVQDKPKHCHPFGCPTYVLNEALQSYRKRHYKWKTRFKFGVYLGQSPLHKYDVPLVFNRNYILVRTQFHQSYQEAEKDIVEHGDEEIDNNQLPPLKTGYPRPTRPLPTWYPRQNNFPDL